MIFMQIDFVSRIIFLLLMALLFKGGDKRFPSFMGKIDGDWKVPWEKIKINKIKKIYINIKVFLVFYEFYR